MAIRKIVGIAAIVAVALTIALVTVATADRPTPTPRPIGSAGPISMDPCENAKITSVTDIESHGTVTERVAYHLTLSSENINNSLGNEELIGDIQYESSLAAVDGFTQYTNTFVADATSMPNLADEKRIGYIADNNSLIAWLDATENGGMTIVFEGDDSGINNEGGLCVFQQHPCIPASCMDVSAGSQLSRVKLVSASIKTSVSVTESPRLHHQITAEGIEGIGAYVDSVLGAEGTRDGPYGVGTVSAGRKMSFTEGRGCNYTNAGGEYYPQAGRTTYDEMTSASGMWRFSKSMTYQSQIPSVGIPRSGPVFHTPA
ncbi:MAG: hypothetical protein C5S38_03690 [Candidatus Methanophagaceae archaeon]|nr:MAG: hypothetical protein C5S38_03690 [Methanophagales archaeon]KAF5430971.1 hypothetical protein C5S36_11740 [Methanophagales archaeon]